ncbi:MAG: lysylphosphatidylglycerol synthase domain-containing protein [Promethearchaeota archaeon]
MNPVINDKKLEKPTIRKSDIFIYFFLLLSVFLAVILFTRQSVSSLLDHITQVSFLTFLTSFMALFGYFFIRSLRWWIILKHLGYSTRKNVIVQSYFAQQITNFSSTLFFGGPMRIFLISRLERVPPHVGVISLSREILSDLIGLLIIIIISIIVDLILPFGLLEFISNTLEDLIWELNNNRDLQLILFTLGTFIIGFILFLILFSKIKPIQRFKALFEKINEWWLVLRNYNFKDATVEFVFSIFMYFSLILHYEILFLGVANTEINLLVSMTSLSVFIFFVTILPVRIGIADITLIGLSRLLEISNTEAIVVSLLSRGIISLFAIFAVPLATRMIKQGINQKD